MIQYADGTVAEIGDHVDWDGIPAVVEFVIDTYVQSASFGLTERGLFFQSDKYGLVFESIDSGAWDSIIFLKRASKFSNP